MAQTAEILEISQGRTRGRRLHIRPTADGNLENLALSENQVKVIRDKYLRDAKSVEAWLLGVARNIALGDLLHSPAIPREKWLKGVRHTVVQKDVGDATTAGRTRSAMEGDAKTGLGFLSSSPERSEGGSGGCGQTVDMILLHQGVHEYEEREKNFRRFMDNLLRLVEEDSEARRIVQETADKFYALLSNFFFLPNSPTLMNAGRALQQLSACYVLPVPDSIEGIFESVKNQALIHKSGGGTGFSFGRIRPKEDEVKTTKGIASGPVSFMKIFDIATEQVKQGGTRRGANMAIMPYTHPDIREFITMKGNGGILENFNISVGIDAAFIDAVRKDEEIELINPKTKKPARKEKARELFDLIIEYAWKCGDPGYVVLDRINNSHSNPTPAIGPIEATNPCGEQPLLPNEPCNLGSISLSKFVRNGELDKEGLGEIVSAAIHFLDNVIDLNNYPTAEIEWMAKGNRRIGLGVMGFAEMLVGLGVPYDGEEAITTAEKVMGFINDEALKASVELAQQRGVFPNFKDSIHDKESIHFRGEDWRPRNCARTTIAPTGTIAIAAGLQGSGIEPFFAVSYTRYNAKGLDAIKQGGKPDPKDVFYEVNPLFREVAARHGFFGLSETDLWEKINRNHGSVRGLPEIPKDIQALFPTSHDVSFEHHIRIQAAFQNHTDNAVSKTINCTNDTTPEQMAKAYLLAYDLGCKGLTVYRDGSKAQQVLNLNRPAEAEAKKQPVRGTAAGTTSEYYEKPTGYGPLHVNIIYDQNGPYRIFTNLPPLGTEISGLTAVIGILLSKYLEIGGDPVRLLKHLNSVKGDKPYGFGPSRVDSIPHAISQVLRDHLVKTGRLQVPGAETTANSTHQSPANGQSNGNTHANGNGSAIEPPPVIRSQESGTRNESEPFCPQCYSRNVEFVSGCKEPTCFDCGFSNCS